MNKKTTMGSMSFDEYCKIHDDDEATVITSNLDRRPSLVVNQERLQKLAKAMTQEERDARDRQVVEMYKPRRNKSCGSIKTNSSRSSRSGGSNSNNSSGASVSSAKKRSGSFSNGNHQLPEHHYPYYDLVVDSSTTATADVILPPTYDSGQV
jgi:hypothetical protein